MIPWNENGPQPHKLALRRSKSSQFRAVVRQVAPNRRLRGDRGLSGRMIGRPGFPGRWPGLRDDAPLVLKKGRMPKVRRRAATRGGWGRANHGLKPHGHPQAVAPRRAKRLRRGQRKRMHYEGGGPVAIRRRQGFQFAKALRRDKPGWRNRRLTGGSRPFRPHDWAARIPRPLAWAEG